MEYIPTIGLEIHAELKTASKMFCSCKNDPDEEKANKNVCSICLGHPGTLPVLNKEAIKHVLKLGVAVNGVLADFTEWDRKNYFYPDIPKGYQITQYKYPLVSDGELAGVAIERIHLEEDTAQSTHDTHKKSLVNFNRSGVPLMELVTKPVIHDAETAVKFAKELQLILRYLGAGEANMEKGEMRVEANISIATKENTLAGKFGTKTEVKNLNSFRSVDKAIAYEIERQAKLLESGEKVVQETRGWDDGKNETYSQRSKESSHDYRYFPEPDIPKLKISDIKEFSVVELKKEIPLLPSEVRKNFLDKFGMTNKEVDLFVDSPTLSKYFIEVVKDFAGDQKKIKLATNYLLSDLLGIFKKEKLDFEKVLCEKINDSVEDGKVKSYQIIKPKVFAELVTMAVLGEISSRGAKDLLGILVKNAAAQNSQTETNISIKALAEKHGLIQKSDAGSLLPAIEKVIIANAKVVTEYKAGKVASLQFLIGQVMKETRGSGNPEMLKKLLIEKLG